MKKKIKFLFLAFILSAFFLIPGAIADSGWDGGYDSGGYDSGGSSWSSGSDWSSSSSYGSSGSSHSSGFSSLLSLVFIFVMMFFIIYISIMIDKRKRSSYVSSPPDDYSVVEYDMEKIQEVLPNFDKDKFQEQAFDLYKKIQVAWMDFDYENMRNYVTDEMFNMYSSQLKALEMKKQKNIMRDFGLNNFSIIGMETSDDTVALKVRMLVECYDYVVDKNNKTVRGNNYNKVVYNYEMTFIKGISEIPNKCPNCNAPLENNNSSKCPYCDSIIIGDNYDWVLSKKRVVSQYHK